MTPAYFDTNGDGDTRERKSDKRMPKDPFVRLIAGCVTLLVFGVCGWAINSVRTHDIMLERHSNQIENLSNTVKDGFREIKEEIRNHK